MPKKNNQGKIGETNFLINFSNQENGNHNFNPSNRHYHNIFRKILIVIIAIIIIYLVGFGIYAIHHHSSSESIRPTRVIRTVHHSHQTKENHKGGPRTKKQARESQQKSTNKRRQLTAKDPRSNQKYTTANKNQVNRTQNHAAKTTKAPVRNNTVNSQIRR